MRTTRTLWGHITDEEEESTPNETPKPCLDLEALAQQWLAAEQQRNEQLLAEMLHQRACILANQRGERFWRS